MRLTIGLGLLLAGCAGAVAQEPKAVPRTLPSLLSEPILERDRDDALARQAEMDKRMDQRTRRAIGSVCVGCGGGVVRQARSQARAKQNVVTEEEPASADAFDPAVAPAD